ncbi:hypothetical protein BGW36DRAFT_428975 [Talaromyces proteolyticus]|uniref:Uncharacterized protein n=1 Tax=Talaromyces proteolyticus TaxID=1131652 RepID=A0AAD4KRR7_9EURO|nr:uncharacterized protein BGW36DRAFT_428975 [Talaromyces proteolyticus]KAH8695087.1 hypothetical protein BGW36DRAFT_428975 [Talaromyces proteolyticus]
MAAIPVLAARDDSNSGALTPSTVNLLISLLVLILLAIILSGSLLVLRQRRRKQQSQLPLYNNSQKHHRRLTITQNSRTGSIHVYNEKRDLLHNSSSPPPSPVPEIRITFPEEEDESGKRKSGRVVVVHISETGGVGLEPCKEELPPYQTNESGRFQSLDLERIGGLKEKDEGTRWS